MKNHQLKYLLSYSPDKVLSKHGVIFRKLFSPVFRNVVAPLSVKNKLVIERRVNLPKNRKYIFAATHRFHDDIIMSMRAAAIHTYLLYGSLPDFFETFHGWGLWLNGVILVDRVDKESRKSAKDKMIYALDLGANILMFPEGTWNKTPNQLVMKLFPGIYDIAKKADALVVPIATIEENGAVYAIVDEPFDITEYSRIDGINTLRDKMCTAKYELMEKHSRACRSDYADPDKYWREFVDGLISTTGGHYDKAVEDSSHYIDNKNEEYRGIISQLKKIRISRHNAFLLRKKR